MLTDYPIDFKDMNGDVIGTGISGTANLVGKDIQYTVTGNVFNISPSNEPTKELLRRILVVPTEASVGKDSGIERANTLQDLRTIEKHIEEILNLLQIADVKIGTTTKEVKAGEIQISRALEQKHELEMKGLREEMYQNFGQIISLINQNP